VTADLMAHANGVSLPYLLRPAAGQDRVTVLADAMRALAEDPTALGADRRLAAAIDSCTREEHEAAWAAVAAQPQPPCPAVLKPPPGTRMLPLAAARQDPPAQAASGTPKRARWRPLRLRAVDGDSVITWSMAASVTMVTVDAAIVSYSHIYGLASGQWGSGAETGIQARLLPLSIDGVIAEASLVMLYAARHKLPTPWLARFMLVLGIAATVGANVTHGLPSNLLPSLAHIVIGALLSAWPAGALIGSMEMAMRLVRDVQAVADGDTPAMRRRLRWRFWRAPAAPAAPGTAAPPAAAAIASAPAASGTAEPSPPARHATPPPAAVSARPASRQARRPRKTPTRQPKTDGAKLAAAKALLDAKPTMTVAELMEAGVSESTARRAKKESGSPATTETMMPTTTAQAGS